MNWPKRVATINALHGHEKGFRHRIGSGNDTGLGVKPGDGGSITIVTEDLSSNGRRLLSSGAELRESMATNRPTIVHPGKACFMDEYPPSFA